MSLTIQMASEKEKKETELTDSRFRNDGQRRTLHAIDDQVEKERRKVNHSEGGRAVLTNDVRFFREKNMNIRCERLKRIF